MILCCGESLIDMLPRSLEGGESCFLPCSGGAIFNTAVSLGRLGVPVSLLSGISTDMFGEQLLTSLKSSNVDVSYLVRSDRPTTLAFVEVSDAGERYHFFDENSAGRELTSSDLPTQKIGDDISALYFGGISLACEPCSDAYVSFCELYSSSCVVMLDPNIRPNFISDVARYRSRLDRMIGFSDILKVSEEDLDWYFGDDSSISSRVTFLRSLGADIIILTRGIDGSVCYLGDAEISVPALSVNIVDTVGAGDTFNAGFLAHLLELGFLEKGLLSSVGTDIIRGGLEFGSRVAGVTISRVGADSPWRSDL